MGILAAANVFSFARILTTTEDMPLDEWRQWRKCGLGGSDAAASMGLAKHSSAMVLYMDKTGRSEDKEDSEKMEAGRVLEPTIAEWFSQKSGKEIVRQPYLYQHPEHSWMLANVDFAIPGEDAGLECKNTAYDRDMDLDEGMIRDEHYLQCNHYMAVTGAKAWYIVYLIEGWKLRWVKIERDEELISEMIRLEENFWYQHILPDVPPLFDGTDASTNLLKTMYPADYEEDPEPVAISEDLETLWDEQAALTKTIGELEKRKKEIKNIISNVVGNHAFGMSDRYIFTYKPITRAGYTVEETKYRQLKAKKRKA